MGGEMKLSIWYRTEENTPSKSGRYFVYRRFGMGGPGDAADYGYLYYNAEKDEWRRGMEYADCYYWTDATPDKWVDSDPPSIYITKQLSEQHPSLISAWSEVQAAVERYEIIKALCASEIKTD
jgi:hypothetical protein